MKKFLCSVMAFLMMISAVGNIGAVQAADDFIVGFIGGSITDGQGVSVENRYSTLVVNNYFKQKYKDKNVIERNASIPGTGSGYGVMRMEKDLGLDTENTPDVVFVEFSVNDAGAIDQTIIKYMESIVRRLALLPKAPSIVFLYSAAYHSTKFGYSGWGSEGAGTLEYTITAASKVAKNYGIYEINFNEYVWDGIQSGKWQWDKTKPDETLSNDELHPNVKGHKVYADMIVDCLKKDESKAFAKPNSDALPIANYVYGRFTNVPLSDESVKLSSGWKKVAASPPSDDSTYTMSREYKDGYIETDDCVGETIEYEFTGRGVGIDKFSYTKNEALLSWAVYDEKGNIEKNGEYSEYSKNGGGARCYGRILAADLPYGKHRLVITGKKNQTAADDSESSGGKEGGTGTFLRIGYIAVESEMPVVLPLAKNVSLSEANGVYTGTYEFDGWGYTEGKSKCGWYVSESFDGQFDLVSVGAKFTPSSIYSGKYLKFGVTPKNEYGTEGITVFSESIALPEVSYGADNLNNKSSDLIVGFIGGSITEGSGAGDYKKRWATMVVDGFFKKNYPNKNVIERNAAIGGTYSNYGMIRIKRDLLPESEATPDVVFVEYAVNDSDFGGASYVSSYMESIVRQLLLLEKIPVIIFVYTNKSDAAAVEKTIKLHKAVADKYGIYQINLHDYIWKGVNENRYVWKANEPSSLTGDGVHPNAAGHKVYADRVIELLEKDKEIAFKKLDPYTEPYYDSVYGEFEEVPVFDNPDVKLTGDWKRVTYEPLEMSYPYIGVNFTKRFYKNGYMQCDNAVNAVIEYEFTGRGIGIDFVRNKNNAYLRYAIYDENGKKVKDWTQNSLQYYNADTDRCCGFMLADNLPYGKYKIIAKGVLNEKAIEAKKIDSNKGGTGLQFNIGYLVVEKSMPKIAPAANNVRITSAIAGQTVTADYDYSCRMYKEQDSDKAWYIGDSENGDFKKVSEGSSYALPADSVGKYIKFGVTPINENGDRGRLIYSETSRIVREVGRLSFKSKISIKVNGAEANAPGIGDNSFSAEIENIGAYDAPVNLVAATYKTEGDYKVLTGSKIVTKTISGGASEVFTLDITAADSDSEIRIYAFSEFMEPVVLPQGNTDYLGVDDENGTPMAVYRINSFK